MKDFLTFLIPGLVAVVLGLLWLRTRHLLKLARQQIQELTITDSLTGLHNRRWFFGKLDQEHERALRYDRNLAVIMLDVDHFKDINAKYGLLVGDQALQALAELIRKQCRSNDFLARYSGQQFIILSPESDIAGAATMAEKLRASVAALRIILDGHDPTSDAPSNPHHPVLTLTASLGVACLDSQELRNLGDTAQIIALAETALSKAKHVGRNRVIKA